MYVDTQNTGSGETEGQVGGALSFEAEDGVIVGGTVDSNHRGYSGEGFVNYLNREGDSVTWAVDSTADGQATLTIDYALAWGQRTMELIIIDENGNEQVMSVVRGFGTKVGLN